MHFRLVSVFVFFVLGVDDIRTYYLHLDDIRSFYLHLVQSFVHYLTKNDFNENLLTRTVFFCLIPFDGGFTTSIHSVCRLPKDSLSVSTGL